MNAVLYLQWQCRETNEMFILCKVVFSMIYGEMLFRKTYNYDFFNGCSLKLFVMVVGWLV